MVVVVGGILYCVNVGHSLDFSCMPAQACRPIEGFLLLSFLNNITFIIFREKEVAQIENMNKTVLPK